MISRRALLTTSLMGLAPRAVRAAGKAEHAVIFIIDGLSYKAVDRLNLPSLRKLISTGTYYQKS